MGKLCRRCGNPNMQAKVKVTSKNLAAGKSFKMTGCGRCITALFLNAHAFGKKHDPVGAQEIEKMAMELEKGDVDNE